MKRSKIISNKILLEYNVTQDDIDATKEFFYSIGYDRSKSIHEQFMAKYADRMYSI